MESKEAVVQKSASSFRREVVERALNPDEKLYALQTLWPIEEFINEAFLLKKGTEVQQKPQHSAFKQEVTKFLRMILQRRTPQNADKVTEVIKLLQELFLNEEIPKIPPSHD